MPVARHLLVASLSLFAAAAGAAQTHYAWVGTYNPNGEGLYRFTVDANTGALRDRALGERVAKRRAADRVARWQNAVCRQ